MGCNAWNHPPECACGWGGIHHGVGEGARHWQRLDSYTLPNARCPHCNAKVFFYCSPYGGSAYFDDLGPPWPKHPCCDARSGTRRGAPLPPPIRMHGWRPIPVEDCTPHADLRLVTEFQVTDESGNSMNLLGAIAARSIDRRAPFLARRHPTWRAFEISTLTPHEAKSSELRFWAAESLDELVSALASAVCLSTTPATSTEIMDSDQLVYSIGHGNFERFSELCGKALGRVYEIRTRKDVGGAVLSSAVDQFKAAGELLDSELIARQRRGKIYGEDGAEFPEVTLIRFLLEVHRRTLVFRAQLHGKDSERRAKLAVNSSLSGGDEGSAGES